VFEQILGIVEHRCGTGGFELYDAVVVACGLDSVRTVAGDGYAMHFVAEAGKHVSVA
jgi:hypothetical protein